MLSAAGARLASSEAFPYLLSSGRAQGGLSVEIQGNLTNAQVWGKIREFLSFQVYICRSSPENLEEDSRRNERLLSYKPEINPHWHFISPNYFLMDGLT